MKDSGFTIVELLLVVAIIGILADPGSLELRLVQEHGTERDRGERRCGLWPLVWTWSRPNHSFHLSFLRSPATAALCSTPAGSRRFREERRLRAPSGRSSSRPESSTSSRPIRWAATASTLANGVLPDARRLHLIHVAPTEQRRHEPHPSARAAPPRTLARRSINSLGRREKKTSVPKRSYANAASRDRSVRSSASAWC